MTKNLRLRAIGILVLSAILFVMPIGAIFANSSMTAPVLAADTDAASDNNANEENEETASDESGDTSGNEDGSASDNEAGEGDAGETEEPVKLTCTCSEHCAGAYSYNANCEACAADYKNCEYVNPNVTISISVPDGWYNDKARVTIAVRDAKDTGNFEIVKIEAKIGHNGSWQDITEDKYIEITENCSVYVQVTDQNNKVYSKNRSIRCFDRTNPTLNAAVSNGLLTIVGYDNDSGIKAFYVNGYEFTEFTNNTLNIRLQQFDTGYEYFTVQAMDRSGNMSEVYKTKNPYYDDDPSDDDDKGASTLPTDATASNPSHATAEVTEHTKTDSQGNTTYSSKQEQEKHQSMAEADAAEEVEKQGDSDEERAETGKEFYTIQTQSEKVFYLIIDRDGEEERVYFLTEIDENDLMNTVSNTSETLPKNSAALESAIPSNDSALNNNNVESEVTVSDGVVSENDTTEEPGEEEPVEEEPEVEESKPQSSMATYLIIGIIGAGAIGAWYYLKMVKGKKEDFLDEDDEEDDEEEYYESDEEEESDGNDFFSMDDDDETLLGAPVTEDMSEDVADTIDDE
ncbi:MAG: DUF4366 domain-containing protein [Eubacteriales bacterium]|nr:DUF4366 domain-containing protein [Eubacteriales bacterium]